MTPKGLAGFALLIGAAAGSWYLSSSLERDDDEKIASPALQSGFYLRSARILGTDDEGDLLYEIRAEYAEQIGENRVEFQNVEIHYTPESEIPWTVNAESAVVTGNQEILFLEGDVVARSNEGFAGEATEIRTETLELMPEQYRAETEDRVEIRVGDGSLTATGMLALLRENQLQLKSNVSGKFVPRTTPEPGD
ncbi:MAG: LPS export ABC transporter periplasmic protein LptC [Gammaproteobacteria bacterium]|nr:LPS export ABC transporter periplasmic protein LptC [Gammaproteobacteria bacterium]MDH4256026.1 LPS export ABC transporter periplasmic protein LptC [Gammaproteobacteria bacterium]